MLSAEESVPPCRHGLVLGAADSLVGFEPEEAPVFGPVPPPVVTTATGGFVEQTQVSPAAPVSTGSVGADLGVADMASTAPLI